MVEPSDQDGATNFPRTLRYVEQLPNGLESFGDCLGKVSVWRTVHGVHGGSLTGLPFELQHEFDHPSSASSWIPQAHVLAFILAMVESSPEVLGQVAQGESLSTVEGPWIRKAARALFATPMYRILMWAASPRLLFKGANLRWSAFFRGSALRSEVYPSNEAKLLLEAPVGLFNEDLASVFTEVLRAAVSFTEESDGHGQATVDFVDFQPGAVEYRGRW